MFFSAFPHCLPTSLILPLKWQSQTLLMSYWQGFMKHWLWAHYHNIYCGISHVNLSIHKWWGGKAMNKGKERMEKKLFKKYSKNTQTHPPPPQSSSCPYYSAIVFPSVPILFPRWAKHSKEAAIYGIPFFSLQYLKPADSTEIFLKQQKIRCSRNQRTVRNLR